MKRKFDQQILDEMSRDPGNWRGPFYYNKKDPRLLVPKLYPMMGRTFNFASPYAYMGLILIITTMLIITIIQK